jgi:hypothetical protein
MTLKNFAFWSRWHLDRAGLSDFDIFLYPAPTPLGFHQPGGKGIAMSLPFVLFASWDHVIKTLEHEMGHALTKGDKEIHGPAWRETMYRKCWYKRTDPIAEEFWNYHDCFMANPLRAGSLEIINDAIAFFMFEEAKQRSKEPRRPGRVRLDFITNDKGEINV